MVHHGGAAELRLKAEENTHFFAKLSLLCSPTHALIL
jgi:hypothetical protein